MSLKTYTHTQDAFVAYTEVVLHTPTVPQLWAYAVAQYTALNFIIPAGFTGRKPEVGFCLITTGLELFESLKVSLHNPLC